MNPRSFLQSCLGNWSWFALSCLMLSGCCHPPPPHPTTRPPYTGPILPLKDVVDKVNDNNEKIPSVWARIDKFKAWYIDPKDSKVHFIDADEGNLMYMAPGSIYVSVKNELADFFQLGANNRTYWLWQRHDHVFWWGDYARTDSNPQAIPINPELVIQVLGILPLDSNLLRQPSPVLRFDNDEDAYMIDWNLREPDRWVAQKEVWYDRATLHPVRVELFDETGRVVLRARLDHFVPLVSHDPSKAGAAGPVMASSYELFFPSNQTTMSFDLEEMQISSSNGFPKPASFRMPNPADLQKKSEKVIEVDKDSEDSSR